MPLLSPTEMTTLRAILARLIPEEPDAPGAISAEVDIYLLRLWAGDESSAVPLVHAGIALLDEAARQSGGRHFAELMESEQDALLERLEAKAVAGDTGELTRFISRMIDWAHEGFYADPGNGGNRDAVSWRAIGYDPRPPLGDFSGAPRLATGPDGAPAI